MADIAYRAWRAMLYVSGSYAYTIQDDKVNESHSHASSLKWGIEEFDEEENELERKLG
ncbi:MAG: hypothetical protein AABX60_01950 [Nanoarchaeota archaeon]